MRASCGKQNLERSKKRCHWRARWKGDVTGRGRGVVLGERDWEGKREEGGIEVEDLEEDGRGRSRVGSPIWLLVRLPPLKSAEKVIPTREERMGRGGRGVELDVDEDIEAD